jgi:hypothetical protein
MIKVKIKYWRKIWNPFRFSGFFREIKSVPTEVNAPKTQTPIVATQNQINGNDKSSHVICGICSFAKFKNNVRKDIVSP